MFKNFPKILAHKSVCKQGNLVLNQYILSKNSNTEQYELLYRYCPHRMYPLHETGEIIQDITCNFHGYKWSSNGVPINNNKKLFCGIADVGRSGLITKNFTEPDAKWVDDLASETNLEYSHSLQGGSFGSWLWAIDVDADLLHIRNEPNNIHPWLSSVKNPEDIEMTSGDGWALQAGHNEWWLIIYPYSFLEWTPGCLAITSRTPNDENSEFGFKWITQFYYDPKISKSERTNFERIEEVSIEDVRAAEKQKGPYFPLMNSTNKLEEHCVHFGQWYLKNKLKK